MSHITHKKAYYVIHSFWFSKRVTLFNGIQESDIPRMIKLLCQADSSGKKKNVIYIL